MILAGVGGFAGTCLRFLTGKLCHAFGSTHFPWGTFAVNLLGSFAIGILFGLAERHNILSPSMNVLLITGFCGGFTTFSTFADDIFLMLQQRHWALLGLYVALSIILGVALVWLGRAAARG